MSELLTVGYCSITYPDTNPMKPRTDHTEGWKWEPINATDYYTASYPCAHELVETNESFKIWVKLPGYQKKGH